MTKRLFLFFALFLQFSFILLSTLPKNVYGASCSVDNPKTDYNTSESIQIDSSNFFTPGDEYIFQANVGASGGATFDLGPYFRPSSLSTTNDRLVSLCQVTQTGTYNIMLHRKDLLETTSCTNGSGKNITVTSCSTTLPKCQIQTTPITRGQSLTLVYNNLSANSVYDVYLALLGTVGSGGSAHSWNTGTSGTSATVSFNPDSRLDSGSLGITVELKKRSNDPNEPRIGCGKFTFISVAAGNLKLIAPVSPITTTITTLPQLILEDPDFVPNNGYTIKLTGLWDLSAGGLLDDTQAGGDGTVWIADSNKRITATNICENGQAGRTDCTDVFRGPGDYIMTVKNFGGTSYERSAFFTVLSSSGGSSGQAGKNPCTDDNNKPIPCRTALGDIPTDPTAFVGKLLTIAISLAGGIALIIMVIGSVKILMSANDPQKVANGRDMIIAAVAGLLFLIFSVLILRYLGSNLFPFFTAT